MLIMQFNYEKLRISPKIHKLIVEIYKISSVFPDEEKFGLTSQIRRAATSVLLNLAEGSARFSKAEFARFLNISIASLVEVDACLKIATTLGFILEKERAKTDTLIQEIYFKLVALRKSQKP